MQIKTMYYHENSFERNGDSQGSIDHMLRTAVTEDSENFKSDMLEFIT